jgi:hypothetical protein
VSSSIAHTNGFVEFTSVEHVQRALRRKTFMISESHRLCDTVLFSDQKRKEILKLEGLTPSATLTELQYAHTSSPVCHCLPFSLFLCLFPL